MNKIKMKLELKITKREIETAVVLLLFSTVVFLAVKSVIYFELKYHESLLIKEISKTQSVRKNSFDNLSLSAKAFYVWDMKDKKAIAGFNEETQFPVASLTKLMTALVASEISVHNTLVTIDSRALDNEGDTGLKSGEKWRLSDIIDFVLVSSSNDGARALASVVNSFNSDLNMDTDTDASIDTHDEFIKEMNNKAKKLGMTQSFYLNESGLDVNEIISGGYGSAKDVTILMENILREYPRLLEASARKSIQINSDIFSHTVDNTNQIVESLPGVIASKTGWTDLAGGNLAVVFDMGIGHPVIVSVLGSTKEGRFDDIRKLIWASIEN